MVLELLGLALGAIVVSVLIHVAVWRTIGKSTVADSILQRGGESALAWLEDAIPDDPNVPPHPAVQKLARYVSTQVAQGIYGAFGNLQQKLEAELSDVDPQAFMKNGMNGVDLQGLLGAFGGGSKNPWSEIAGLFSLFQTFGAAQGGNGAATAGGNVTGWG